MVMHFFIANLDEYNCVKHPTGSSVAAATKRSYVAPKILILVIVASDVFVE